MNFPCAPWTDWPTKPSPGFPNKDSIAAKPPYLETVTASNITFRNAHHRGLFRAREYDCTIVPFQSFLFLPDEKLLDQCRVDHYRGSGPGGQKRNKTSNAVRLTHLPTRVTATATESRSLAENHLNCLRRLRVKMAAEIREIVNPIDFPITGFNVPDWFLTIRHGNKIPLSHRHEFYSPAAGLMLDLLSINGNPAAVAANLGITTTAVIKLLESETAWWAAANAIRQKLGLPAMQSRGKRK